MTIKFKRAQRRSRIWITLLADAALIEMAGRTDIGIDDQQAVLNELRSRIAKLSKAAEVLAVRLKEPP